MKRFFVYEEYGAKYELMIKDIAVVHRTMPQWDRYQKGLEALASSIGPVSSYDDQSKKALTVGDLLVKVGVFLAHGRVATVANPRQADPKSMQISAAFRRAVKAHARMRLPVLVYGNREYSGPPSRSDGCHQPGNRRCPNQGYAREDLASQRPPRIS